MLVQESAPERFDRTNKRLRISVGERDAGETAPSVGEQDQESSLGSDLQRAAIVPDSSPSSRRDALDDPWLQAIAALEEILEQKRENDLRAFAMQRWPSFAKNEIASWDKKKLVDMVTAKTFLDFGRCEAELDGKLRKIARAKRQDRQAKNDALLRDKVAQLLGECERIGE